MDYAYVLKVDKKTETNCAETMNKRFCEWIRAEGYRKLVAEQMVCQ